MEEATVEANVIEGTAVTVTVTEPDKAEETQSDFWRNYAIFAVIMLGLFVVFAVNPVGAQANTLDIDAGAVRGGIFDGANLILGAGILGILMLPAGIKFGLNLLADITGAFANIRVGR